MPYAARTAGPHRSHVWSGGRLTPSIRRPTRVDWSSIAHLSPVARQARRTAGQGAGQRLIRARSGAADRVVKTWTGVSAPRAAASIQSCSSRSGPPALLPLKTSSMLVGADARVRPARPGHHRELGGRTLLM